MTAQNIRIQFIFLAILAGCGQRNSADNHVGTDSTKFQETVEIPNPVDTVTSTEDNDYYDCIRGQAESVIKKDVYPNSVFKLNTDNFTGTETVELKNGERLIINNWGCEYYVLTFRFEVERYNADTTDTQFWLDKAVILMKEIEPGLDAPLDIETGTTAIINFLKENKEYRLGDEFNYNDELIMDLVSVDRIQKINDKRFAVEISFAKGPL